MANSNGWGDGAANNSIGWGQGANNAIAWGDSHAKSWAGATDIVGLTTDPAASAYFTSTGITGATEQTAIDNLVKGLKSDGLWSKMKAVYPFVTDNRNLLGYTEDFSNAAWGKSNITVTTNTATAPNGTLTADSLIDNTSNTSHPIFQFGNPLTTGPMVGSVYLKDNGRRFAVVSVTTGLGTGTRYSAVVDLQTGTITQNNTLGSPTNTSSSIENVGNGWYRVSVRLNCTLVSTNTNYLVIATSNTGTPTVFDSGNLDPIYSGNGSSIFLWGAQLELGSTATTYQPIATTQQAFISSQFKYNLVNPVDSDAAFRLVFNGGWTHSANGATPNGTNGYADTRLVPSTNGFTTSNAHISFYSRSTTVNGLYPVDMGVDQTGTGLNVSQKMSSPDSLSYHGRAYAQVITGTDTNNTAGLHTITRTSTTSLKYNRNGNLIQTNSTLEIGTIPTVALFIGSTNNNGTASLFSTRQAAFASIGNGLTDTEAANLYTRVQAFQTALSRQV